jgi:phosphoglycolate phosphatase
MIQQTQRFDSLILDIDGTLWNTTGIVAGAWNKAVCDIQTKYRDNVYSKSSNNIATNSSAPFDVAPVTGEILQHEFGKTMDTIADDIFPSVPQPARAELLKRCCAYEHEAVDANSNDISYPLVSKTIAELSKKIKLFIVSNCQKGYIELTMKKLSIEQYITDNECFGNTGKGKAENIKMLIKRNHLACAMYVGDTQGDCDACKEACVPFIWAAYGFGTADSFCAKINSFAELADLFA